MEDIILQTVVKMIEEVVGVLLHGGMNNIGAVIQKLQKIANTAVLEIQNNWEAVVKRMQNDVCGSCTEPLVSHVLSERLSRNPLSWSEDGLRQMAMLRAYTQNGGVVTARDVRVSRSKTERNRDKAALRDGFARYRQYADKRWTCS